MADGFVQDNAPADLHARQSHVHPSALMLDSTYPERPRRPPSSVVHRAVCDAERGGRVPPISYSRLT